MFNRLFRKDKNVVASNAGADDEQAVIVYLNGTDLPQEIYDQYDLATIEDQLIQVINTNGLGEYDGHEIGPAEVIIYLYGPDAEALFAGIELTLRDYPLCKSARVVIRFGSPGSPQRVVTI